ncbi:2-oxo-4-hydroxy-4-carboxy-5-ureidoimidazoline decarboxylase-like [Exaiptasia diaphana]|uniref:2-oxo-4-hydroxy-4-carboxy-5-ureidoimidazoline decarboxylase n=1 Tax=Exaiptasia diaphana TaxID=2652724 RepID=A0A913XBU3_EXADI|nr:2-oxo-4-hydroxy-4-carboxy-5-ureidoimidazoline decarboxylase-like [Exaiptasia diaphana]
MDIVSVNQLSNEDFISQFGNVVECTSLCAAAVAGNRPFLNFNDLYRNLCDFIDALPSSGRAGILRSHPDLAGRLAKANALTVESTQEQASAGLSNLTKEEMQLIDKYNQDYRQKFGFPFVICARLNNKERIINALKARLVNDLEQELNTGIEEVKKIMLLRLKDIVKTDSNL